MFVLTLFLIGGKIITDIFMPIFKVGGGVIKVDKGKGELELLFVSPKAHSKGIGYAAWRTVERLHPEVKIFEDE